MHNINEIESALSDYFEYPLHISHIDSFLNSSGPSDIGDIKFEVYCSLKSKKEEIPFCEEDCSECDLCEDEEEKFFFGIPDVEYIIFNDPATIVFWDDGTKTVVKVMEGEKFEKYAGFAMACMKKMFGSTSRAKAIMAECDEDNWKSLVEEQKDKKQKKKNQPSSLDEIIRACSDALRAIILPDKEDNDETSAE